MTRGSTKATPDTTSVTQPGTDDSIRVRQFSPYQFSPYQVSRCAHVPEDDGRTPPGAGDESRRVGRVLTVDTDDADAFQDRLRASRPFRDDVGRRVVVFGTIPVGKSS